jgi:5'-nucleotidase
LFALWQIKDWKAGLTQKIQMKRRDFLEKTAATTAVLGLGLSLSSFES